MYLIIQGKTISVLVYPIEGYHRTTSLFVVGFNSNILYELLYIALTCGNSYMCPKLNNCVGGFSQILIFVRVLVAH